MAVLTTHNATPGEVVVRCQVTDDNGLSAQASTTVMIHALPAPPSIICSASPATADAGGSVTIAATASSAQGRPLTYAYAAQAGSIRGTGSMVTLDTHGVAPGADSVTCTVTDDEGLSASGNAVVTINTPPMLNAFTLAGLTSPATVAESIFVFASGVPSNATVAFYIDDQLKRTETQAPFWLGGLHGAVPAGYSVAPLAVGSHTLRAVATLADGARWASSPVSLQVVASNNARFSLGLAAYANQPSAQQNSLLSLLGNTTTPGATLSPSELATRQSIMAMYRNWGIDPSLDYQDDQSAVLLALLPANWAAPTNAAAQPSLRLSPDAPFYQAIPSNWPRVMLPPRYFGNVQLNTTRNGDGIGYGEVSASSSDRPLLVRSQWYKNLATRKEFLFRIPADWAQSLPIQVFGDSHMLFLDAASASFVSSYKTTRDSLTGGPDALYASNPTPFNSLGDHGGSTAAGFAELPVMIQPGELTDPGKAVAHAIGGALGRTWAARVYPATAWDSGVRTSINTCTSTGFTNTGLVPYGGIIQLDPKLDLTQLALSLPALRILQAMQFYGYYVMDFGCADFDIYTAIDGGELDPYGGLWGYNQKGPGVQNEIEKVITSHTLYVVAPLFKKQ